MYVPTWDRLETCDGDSMYGLFQSSTLEFRDASGKHQIMRFRDIAEVTIDRGGFLADAALATITTTRGQTVCARVAHGEIALDRFGTIQRHKLRNVRRIVPGLARVRHHFVSKQNRFDKRSKIRPHTGVDS